jgi:hypothetical protein
VKFRLGSGFKQSRVNRHAPLVQRTGLRPGGIGLALREAHGPAPPLTSSHNAPTSRANAVFTTTAVGFPSDVRQEDGIWFLDINDESGKHVKNEQSKRRVPLHSKLRRLGFLEYVQATASAENDRIFPQLRPGGPDKKLGYYFTKWWTQYRKDVGAYEKNLDYQSFRGGVTTKLAAAGVAIEGRNELLGHEGKSVETNRPT